MPRRRSVKYRKLSPELVSARVRDYMASPPPHTVEGLCLAVGFCGRCQLIDYRKQPEYKEAIDKAYNMIIHEYIVMGMNAKNPAMYIYLLKTMGLSEGNKIDISADTDVIGGIQIILEGKDDKKSDDASAAV